MQYYRFPKSTSGFTLVETLVAILALSLSLGALTLLTARSVTSARTAELRFTAEFLATEGVEIIKQRLMSSMIPPGGNSFESTATTLVNSTCNSGSCAVDDLVLLGDPITNCAYDPNSSILPSCARMSDVGSQSGSDTVFRRTGSGTHNTPFWRLVFVSPSASGGVYIRSVVWYQVGAGQPAGKIELTTEIKNWYIVTP